MVLTETDYFATSAEITSLLNIGTGAGTVYFSDTDLDAILPIIQGEVHDFLIAQGLISSSPIASTETGYYTVKSVLVALIMAWNQRRQFNKVNNQTENAGLYLESFPHLTREMQLTLLGAFILTDDDSVDSIPMYRGQYHSIY
jgi:hypothetical protein